MSVPSAEIALTPASSIKKTIVGEGSCTHACAVWSMDPLTFGGTMTETKVACSFIRQFQAAGLVGEWPGGRASGRAGEQACRWAGG